MVQKYICKKSINKRLKINNQKTKDVDENSSTIKCFLMVIIRCLLLQFPFGQIVRFSHLDGTCAIVMSIPICLWENAIYSIGSCLTGPSAFSRYAFDNGTIDMSTVDSALCVYY